MDDEEGRLAGAAPGCPADPEYSTINGDQPYAQDRKIARQQRPTIVAGPACRSQPRAAQSRLNQGASC